MISTPVLHLRIEELPELILNPSDAATFLSCLYGNVLELSIVEDNYGVIIVGSATIIHEYEVPGEDRARQTSVRLSKERREILINLLLNFLGSVENLRVNQRIKE